MNTNAAIQKSTLTADIDRVKAKDLPKDQFIRQYFLKNKPVIIEDSLGAWPAAKWTLDNIKNDIPNQKVKVRNDVSGKLFDSQTMSQTISEVDLHAFIDLINSGKNETPMYLAQTSFQSMVPNAEDFVTRFAYMRKYDYLLRTNIWIGTPGLATPAHFDFAHNFYSQIWGHKSITLFSPEDSPYLYPNPRFPVVAQVDVGNPDLQKHPDFNKAKPIQFMLSPGDTVFIPAHWWHFIVSSYDNNIAINHWFLRIWSRNLSQAKMVPPLIAIAVKGLLGLNK